MVTSAEVSAGTTGVALTDGLSGHGHAVSLEAGQRIAIDEELSITPQVQVTASRGAVGDFTDSFGTSVSGVSEDRTRIRLGISVDKEVHDFGGREGTRLHVYGIGNLYYDINDLPEVLIGHEGENEMAFASGRDRLRAGISVGASYNWNDDQTSIYGEATFAAGLRDPGHNHIYKAVVGFRHRW